MTRQLPLVFTTYRNGMFGHERTCRSMIDVRRFPVLSKGGMNPQRMMTNSNLPVFMNDN